MDIDKLTPQLHFPNNTLQQRSLQFLYTPTATKAEAKEKLCGSLCQTEIVIFFYQVNALVLKTVLSSDFFLP